MKNITFARAACLIGLAFLTFGIARADQIVYPQAAVGPIENSVFEIHLRLGNANQDEPWQGTIRLLRQADLAGMPDLDFRDEDNQPLPASSGALSIQIPAGQSRLYRISASTLQIGVLLIEAESGSTTTDLVDSFFYFLVGASGRVADVIAVQGQRGAHGAYRVMMSSVPTFTVGVAAVAARSLPSGGIPSPNTEPTPVTMTVVLEDGRTFVGDPVILDAGAGHQLQQALFPTEVIPELPQDAAIAQLRIESPQDLYVTTLAVGSPPDFEDVQIGAAAAALEGGGLASVAADTPITGDGTPDNPLGIEDAGITGALLADDAVSTAKLANAAVTGAKIADGAVSAAKLAVAAVTGAKIAGQAVSTAKLEDGAVTGPKLADGALVAGQNMTITRQGSGALELSAAGGSSGISLPFAGSASSANAALSVENTGSGDGVNIPSAGGDGVQVDQAGVNGMVVASATYDGLQVQSAGRDGVRVSNAARGVAIGTTSSDGISVGNAARFGLLVQQATDHGVLVGQANDGVHINSANGAGMLIGAAQRGVDVVNATTDGLIVRQASTGVHVQQASTGVNVQSAGSFGLLVGTTGSNGIQINQAGVDGIQIQSAGRDGIRIGGATEYGILAAGATGAAFFQGDVTVTGTLSKSGGSFKIDDPLDPANKYLQHSFVESPDMMNVYNGNVTLNASGEAVVELPDYFEALNRDFRYQLTAVGAPGPYLYVAEEIQGNQFRIAGGAPGMKVSWQVTGDSPGSLGQRAPHRRGGEQARRRTRLLPAPYPLRPARDGECGAFRQVGRGSSVVSRR